jgi:hypothetical protein
MHFDGVGKTLVNKHLMSTINFPVLAGHSNSPLSTGSLADLTLNVRYFNSLACSRSLALSALAMHKSIT